MANVIRIKWADNLTGNTVNPTHFIVERSATETGTYAQVGANQALGAGVVGIVDSAVADGETWWYKVGAVYASGNTKYLAASDITVSISGATPINFTLIYMIESPAEVYETTSGTSWGGKAISSSIHSGDFDFEVTIDDALKQFGFTMGITTANLNDGYTAYDFGMQCRGDAKTISNK